MAMRMRKRCWNGAIQALVTGTAVVNGTIEPILEVARGEGGLLWDQHRGGCANAGSRAVLPEVDIIDVYRNATPTSFMR